MPPARCWHRGWPTQCHLGSVPRSVDGRAVRPMVVPGDGFVTTTTTTFCDGSGEFALTAWRLEILLRVEEWTSVANLGAIVSMQWTTWCGGWRTSSIWRFVWNVTNQLFLFIFFAVLMAHPADEGNGRNGRTTAAARTRAAGGTGTGRTNRPAGSTTTRNVKRGKIGPQSR